MCTDAKSGDDFISRPTEVYLASNRMVNLFQGVEGVLLLDSSYACLRGEAVREMLEACGGVRILRTIAVPCDLPEKTRREYRRAAGCESCTYENSIFDQDITGLDGLLALLPTLPEAERRDRSRQLWEALAELADRRANALSVQYSWTYHYQRTTSFDAHFIRKLNAHAWISDRDGVLRLPSEMLFEDLDWPTHPLLESRIQFKPPAIAALAREVGIDTDVLDELKRLGVTDLAQLRTRLKVDPDDESDDDRTGENHSEASDHDEEDGYDVGDGEDEDAPPDGDGRGGDNGEDHDESGSTGGGGGSSGSGSGKSKGKGTGGNGNRGGEREFISYVAAHVGEGEADPDGLTQEARMRLEDHAIARILEFEPRLERLPPGNKGFDLIETDAIGEPQRWIEVKAMTGSLAGRPVGLSQPQMEHARRYGDQYWLYVVEHAEDDARARIVKIRNPFGRTGTFTFDRGWTAVAIIQNCANDTPNIIT
ncbi:DUF3883 domain-containing protein [Sphingomonas sp. LY54]|uniref:DUF3883 domain-containing protein n=1 Tax=Sphingomonas sp. LY54 TaxID=3095343 RepID=UPI002D7820AA|nr:DUF3883 domain-containing protein [Sphingomonas sp. LY54]WRP29023.1 DUF3883 domain-containing protein [Sphingomonas sp. LY54]